MTDDTKARACALADKIRTHRLADVADKAQECNGDDPCDIEMGFIAAALDAARAAGRARAVKKETKK